MFESIEEFVAGLKIDDSLKQKIEQFIDGNIGFCLALDYSDKDYKHRSKDEKCLIKVIYEKDSPSKKRDNELIPISVIVKRGVVGGILTQALYKTQYSIKFASPIDFDLKEGFLFDHHFKSFSFKGDSKIFSEVIQELFEIHIKPCRPIVGFTTRAARASFYSLEKLLSGSRKLILKVLKYVFGKEYMPVFESPWDSIFYGYKDERFEYYRKSWLHRIKDNEIVYQNIKTTKNILVSGSLFWLLIFALINFYPPVSNLSGTTILSAVAAIITLFIFESIIPIMLLWKLNLIVWIQRKIFLERVS